MQGGGGVVSADLNAAFFLNARRNIMKHKIILLTAIALAAVLSSACSLYRYTDKSETSSETHSESSSSTYSEPIPVGGIIIPTEFDSDDLFLQDILIQKAPSAVECAVTWFKGMTVDYIGECELMDFIFEESTAPAPYYCLAETFPQTAEEMEKHLKQFFTSEVTARFMKNVSRGTMTENADGTYAVKIDVGESPARFIEIDGKMYCSESTAGSGLTAGYWNTAKVTSRTNDTITFTYIYAYYGELTEGKGTLKKEDGDWKFERCECWLTD